MKLSENYEFHEEIAYAYCPICRGKIQALKEEENEEGEKTLVDDANKRLEVVKAHFEKCEEGNPYTGDPYATYPENSE